MEIPQQSTTMLHMTAVNGNNTLIIVGDVTTKLRINSRSQRGGISSGGIIRGHQIDPLRSKNCERLSVLNGIFQKSEKKRLKKMVLQALGASKEKIMLDGKIVTLR
jgi:hypothetical protein